MALHQKWAKVQLSPKAHLGHLKIPPAKFRCSLLGSFRENLWKCKCELKSYFGLWLCNKSDPMYSYPCRHIKGNKEYSCVIWLKSIPYFQCTEPELKVGRKYVLTDRCPGWRALLNTMCPAPPGVRHKTFSSHKAS